MEGPLSFEWNREHLALLPEKAVLLPEHDALLLSDLHFGKTAHFRKNGLALPAKSAAQDFSQLAALLNTYPAKHIYFLGDLFHSEENYEWEQLLQLLKSYPDRQFYLIPGNHDVIETPPSTCPNLAFTKPRFKLGHLILCHDPQHARKGEASVCGHVHPGFRLKGLGKQSIMLPAFYATSSLLLLPAFGALTGLLCPALSPQSVVAIIGPSGVQWVPGRNIGA